MKFIPSPSNVIFYGFIIGIVTLGVYSIFEHFDGGPIWVGLWVIVTTLGTLLSLILITVTFAEGLLSANEEWRRHHIWVFTIILGTLALWFFAPWTWK